MRASTAILVALLVLGAAACGGDDSDPRERVAEDSPQTQAQRTSETEAQTTATEQAQSTPPPDEGDGGGGDGRTIKISASDFPGGTWPLTIESGELRCEDTETSRTIIFRANGHDYPVNGVAPGGKVVGIEPIWRKKKDRNAAGTRMDITPLFNRGYKLCD